MKDNRSERAVQARLKGVKMGTKLHSGNRSGRRHGRLHWLWVLLIQIVSSLLIALPLSLSLWLGGAIHNLCRWGLSSIAGFVSACIATRKGLLNYAAWIAPPVMLFVGYVLVWGYAPSAGPVFLCDFVSLVGAATGEVLNQRQKKK